MNVTSYKKYKRGTRTEVADEQFNLGMTFRTSPVRQNANKVILNYDVTDSGNKLRTRRGLRAFKVTQESGATTQEYINDNIAYDVVDTFTTTEENVTRDVVLLNNLDFGITELDRDRATRSCILTTVGGTDQWINPLGNDEVETVRQETDSTIYNVVCNKLDNSIIHGIPTETEELMYDPISTEVTINGVKRYVAVVNNEMDRYRQNVKVADKGQTLVVSVWNGADAYRLDKIEPYKATAHNASQSMFNMLSDDPYAFENVDGYPGFQLMGIYPVDKETNKAIPISSTYRNTSYKFVMQYGADKIGKFKVVWEWSNAYSSNFDKIKEQIIDFNVETMLPAIELDWNASVPNAQLKVSVYQVRDYEYYDYNTNEMKTRTGDFDPSAVQVMLANITFSDRLAEGSRQQEFLNFDLATCKGLASWGSRVVAYNIEKAENALFMSEPGNPGWFPYPRNVCTFPDPIIKCVEMNNKLIVFTTKELYSLTLTSTGDAWTQVRVQNNLNIKYSDMRFITSIQNMVFFKSNNQFYMLVPSTMTATGTSIAPITKDSIDALLDDFPTNLDKIINDTYDGDYTVYTGDTMEGSKNFLKLVTVDSYVDYNSVYIHYIFKNSNKHYLNMILIYNIEGRYWRMYSIESEALLRMHSIDATGNIVYIAGCSTKMDNVVSYGVQYLQYSSTETKDFYIRPFIEPKGTSIEPYRLSRICSNNAMFKNYAYIDTGAREHDPIHKKRYREVQISLNNIDQKKLVFYTVFSIDGALRQTQVDHQLMQFLNPADPRYGEIVYQRTFEEDPRHTAPGATSLGEMEYDNDEDELFITPSSWTLDESVFPEVTFWKLRFPVSGKGYTPQITILNRDEQSYEILNLNWVFRALYSR